MQSNYDNGSEKQTSATDMTLTSPAATEVFCQKCHRIVSQATGKCYYCAEPEPEDLKKLSLIMLDWQHKAASDPQRRTTANVKKLLSLMQALQASACLALFIVPGFIPFQSRLVFLFLGVLMACSCWSFCFSSLWLIFALLTNAAVMFFSLDLAFSGLPYGLSQAFAGGFIASLSAFTLFLIIVRICKNKAVEI